jgi:adenine C2-methylase RlmN of 23S rRNA A2503 and tRNA A37
MNWEAVKSAVKMMIHPSYFGLGRQQVTISTVGIIPKIRSLHDELPGVSLALSLHAPTQELRSSIVPSAKAFKLEKLMDAVADYEMSSGLKVFYEYVMLAGINDSEEVAHQLGQLLRGRKGVLNLIPWNPTYVMGEIALTFKAPAQDSVLAFQQIVRRDYGVSCTVRQEKGQDVEAACGMLVIKKQLDW